MEKKDKWEKPRLTIIATGGIKEDVLTISGPKPPPPPPPPSSS